MNPMQDLASLVMYHNSIADYATSLVVTIGAMILVKMVSLLIVRRLRAWPMVTESPAGSFFVANLRSTAVPLFHVLSLYLGISLLQFPDKTESNLRRLFILVFTIIAVRFFTALVRFSFQRYRERRGHDDESLSAGGVSSMINLLIWSLGALFLLDNLGFKISAVVTGLGIGGVALALAAQTVLRDFFCYFVIILDRPFTTGDFISIDALSGTIEHIGIKSTRIKSLSGEEMVFTNTDITNARIHNFKKMAERRVEFTITVDRRTPIRDLEAIPGIVEGIVTGEPEAVFDRAHFKGIGDTGLIYEIVFFVKGYDYRQYMNVRQGVNLGIMAAFERRRIALAGAGAALPAETAKQTRRRG